MENNILFEIQNLECQYKSNPRPILEIESLKINKGEITFFIGTSGSGKSTILEAMGLMNDPIKFSKESIFNFYPINGENNYNYFDLWKNKTVISKIRRNHFSFIFQSNNLFNSLNGHQNVILPYLLRGKTKQEALRECNNILNDILSDLNLSEKEIENINISEISGGQKQRLAFARGIITQYDVLFADEPTGNLDWYNARYIMRKLINRKNPDSSVIIVSHDISLATEFADKIVFIERNETKVNGGKIFSYGKINKSGIFRKQEEKWINGDNQEMENNNLKDYLKNKFIPKENSENKE